MRLEQHVLCTIDDYSQGKKDSSLMHACIAIDGTAKKLAGESKSSSLAYKNCLREYWWLIERFLGAGINLEETRWTYINLDNGYGKKIVDPDLADVIYHIFRCNHVHSNEVPLKYSLLPVSDGHSTWMLDFRNGSLQMPERIIWALLAVAVFARVNADIQSDGEYYLTWGNKNLGETKFLIKESWGKEDEMRNFFTQHKHIRVKMNF